ncbi:MAG: hypothetical protein JJT94_00430 [Bernardetiaceae bacterium]|nr:hypothetical protein [Bernardetiaceae bacterium]
MWAAFTPPAATPNLSRGAIGSSSPFQGGGIKGWLQKCFIKSYKQIARQK